MVEGAVFCQRCGARLPVDDDGQQSDMPAVENESSYELLEATLVDAGTNKIGVIKAVRELTGPGLEEAKKLVESVPVLLKKDVTHAEAQSIKEELIKAEAVVKFTDQEGNCVNIVLHCKSCGAVLQDGCDICKVCGCASALQPKSDAAVIEDAARDFFDVNVWADMIEEFNKMPVARKVITVLGILLAAGLVILAVIMLFRLIFTSPVVIIAAVALGYIAYQMWGAIYVTQYKYNQSSKELQLPAGMTSQTLLEELSGTFNYPYFKGIRYGENGECIIEGKCSTYPVVFDEKNKAVLTCSLPADEKKQRVVMLEAIAICSYINKFFNPSLPFDAIKDLKSLEAAESQRRTSAIVLSVASALFIIIIALEYALPGSVQRVIKPGVEVREAYLTQYSEAVTVEDAFENFFANGKWSTYEAEGYSFVAFTGSCEFMEEEVDIRITFKITGEQFLVDNLDVNGREQSELMLYSLLSKVYEDY